MALAARTANWLTLVLCCIGAASAPVVHALGVRCWVYLPAHLAPLLAGLVLGANRGLLVGAVVGICDLLFGGRLHGMQAYAVMSELATYGYVAGVLRPRYPTLPSLLPALVGAMLAGRLVYLLFALVIGKGLVSSLHGLFVIPWPGILLQLILLPVAALLLLRALRR